MKIYIRKLFDHDITHQISVTKEIVKDFFEDAQSFSCEGKTSKAIGNVSILLATDPRFGGDIKSLLNKEGAISTDDIIIFYKKKDKYTIELIKKGSPKYDAYDELYNENARHTVVEMDDAEDFPVDMLPKAKNGYNKIFYGAPGCGKSYFIETGVLSGVDRDNRLRTTFHPDYANSDFVGQIMPKVDGDKVTYEFNPGPFALALKKAYQTNKMVYLVVEEINRGNASAIFGDLFQLLDRIDDDNDNLGRSRYSITNVALQKYLSDELGVEFNSIIIPTNLTILATMNSSDQNVFTLDTAFKRRWNFEQMPNTFDSTHQYKDWKIPGTNISWEQFVNEINNRILTIKVNNSTSEDKRLGKYFVGKDCLTENAEVIANCKEQANKFAYKVLEYLWNDVCKLSPDDMFVHGPRTLEELIEEFHKSQLNIFINATDFGN